MGLAVVQKRIPTQAEDFDIPAINAEFGLSVSQSDVQSALQTIDTSAEIQSAGDDFDAELEVVPISQLSTVNGMPVSDAVARWEQTGQVVPGMPAFAYRRTSDGRVLRVQGFVPGSPGRQQLPDDDPAGWLRTETVAKIAEERIAAKVLQNLGVDLDGDL